MQINNLFKDLQPYSQPIRNKMLRVNKKIIWNVIKTKRRQRMEKFTWQCF